METATRSSVRASPPPTTTGVPTLPADLNNFLASLLPGLSTSSKLQNSSLLVVLRKLPVKIERKDKGEYTIIRTCTSDDVAAAVETMAREEKGGRVNFSQLIWVGGLRSDVFPEDERDQLEAALWRENMRPVWFDISSLRLFIEFSKQSLWPMMNSQLITHKFHKKEWRAYKQFNQAVAEVVKSLCGGNAEDNVIWIHNYHLLLVPALLRKMGVDSRIGYFSHSSWPTSEIFRVLPMRRTLLEGVLGADLIGFQTHHDSNHFMSACMRLLAAEVTARQVRSSGTPSIVGVFPIGLDIGRWRTLARSSAVQARAKEIQNIYHGKKLIVGKDTFDYPMGVNHKLCMFAEFLENYPEWRGKVILFQICTPRDGLQEESVDVVHLQHEINENVGKINGKWSSADFSPISYLYKEVDEEEVAALFTAADAALVTPLRDGMNLMAQEFVVCQEEGGKAPLLLSEFAGASQSLVGALPLNPWDIKDAAQKIHRALTMPDEEKAIRHSYNLDVVRRNTAAFWGSCFLAELATIDPQTHRPLLRFSDVITAYRKARSRLFLFDYDGTLTPIVKYPIDATPSNRLLRILDSLCRDERNHVVIISGRERTFLEPLFGNLPVGLSCEHGVFFRPYGHGKQWIHADLATEANNGESWKDVVLPILQDYCSRTPGSMIEVKEVNLSWHYRNADEDFGSFQAKELAVHLQDLATKLPIEILLGKKVIEVRPANVNKGAIVRKLLCGREFEFVLCLGDDRTDEDMFGAVNALCKDNPFTCVIGKQPSSQARYYLRSQSDVLDLLSELVGEAPQTPTTPVSRLPSPRIASHSNENNVKSQKPLSA
jgi:trehalose-phosphatase